MSDTYSPRLRKLRIAADEVVLLPYTLAIADCFFLQKALGDRRLVLDGHAQVSETVLHSAFDLYELDRAIDETEVSLVAADSPDIFVHWDGACRFVAVGGSHGFCADAVPYPMEVRRHYFLEGSLMSMSFEAAQRVYADLTKVS